jgi:hypothetical protein
MKQLSDGDSNVILNNVFTVEPSNQQRLVQLLTRATDNAVSRANSWIDFPRPKHELGRSKIRSRSSRGTPGPWSLTSMLPSARALIVTSVRGGAWATAFSIRLRIASSMA